MAYRIYLGYLPTKEVYTLNEMNSLEELIGYTEDDESDSDFHLSIPVNRLIEINMTDDHSNIGIPLFNSDSLNDRFSDYDYRIVTVEFLDKLIDTYKEKIRSMYEGFANMLDDALNENIPVTILSKKEKNAIYKLRNHLRDRQYKWEYNPPFTIGNDAVSDAMYYEYAIFELVRIRKTFDFETKTLIVYGS